ncbi:palmitoyltransferase ZDHHC6 [Sitodiplosis mosellana]|uniref:palmitoyltransferase ZDHHC6 n=1 Tax=Sitodiplosis mosellana TaxID=263140 RepID=UPI002443A983|nr:palmitoyltransferase ZDHHC6 [Sitodiplosis mosellana]XP_055325008.1 palmitoyltransferase ZDHHC6 [Sitodiplosis mosellana]
MSSSLKKSLKRFLHWGPAVAIGIIKCVTLTTLYINSMWWPPNRSVGGMIHQMVFLILSALSAFNYVMGTICGPGFLPLKWEPKDKRAKKMLQYCSVCEGYKAPRSHHCRKCERCVMKMDHHCPWLNTCVGWNNHAYFTSFLAFSVLGCIQSTIILSASIYRGIHYSWYIYTNQLHLATVQFGMISLSLSIFSLGLSVGVVIAVGMLLYFQVRAIMRNRTGIEDWILEKANYRYEGSDKNFIFPYDLGTWDNIKQVADPSCAPIGDGIHWKVRSGCNQYTLTIEQIAQKEEKRARTRTYSIQKAASGSWLPFWTQGFVVALNTPCTDEPRIKLDVGDIVKVTRWKKYWLFGEKVQGAKQKTDKNGLNDGDKLITKKIRIRGWLPRKCAVELVNPDSDDEHEHFTAKKFN